MNTLYFVYSLFKHTLTLTIKLIIIYYTIIKFFHMQPLTYTGEDTYVYVNIYMCKGISMAQGLEKHTRIIALGPERTGSQKLWTNIVGDFFLREVYLTKS